MEKLPMDSLTRFVDKVGEQGRLVVQPRMGFGTAAHMLAGLRAVKSAHATTVGTITLDSFTRVRDFAGAADALRTGAHLNGFPLVSHGPEATRELLEQVVEDDFPVQVRHGSPLPSALLRAVVDSGLDATEGGPVSYSLPYGKTPVQLALRDWSAAVEDCAARSPEGFHVETFGGCMLGQLCPPSLLVAVSLLEALYFEQHGVTGVSLSYAQQTNLDQDLEAVAALRRLAGRYLTRARWHIVVYTFMGLYPLSPGGSLAVLAESVELSVRAGARRLIVKTPAESYRIPTIEENVASLEFAAARARHPLDPGTTGTRAAAEPDSEVYREAEALIEAALELDPDAGRALVGAILRGYLDVPFCLHPDNARRSSAVLGPDGRLRWTRAGAMPISLPAADRGSPGISSGDLLRMLEYKRRRFDTDYGSAEFDGWTARFGSSSPDISGSDSSGPDLDPDPAYAGTTGLGRGRSTTPSGVRT